MAKTRIKPDVDQEQDSILARIDERLKNIVAQQEMIYAEVKKTNGRVNKIESERLPALEHWKSKMSGVWLAIVIGATAIGSIAGFVFAYIIPHQ